MIQDSQKLNTKIFDADVEQVPIRKGFGEGLLDAGRENPDVVGLCADLTESTQMHLFKKEFPDRFIEIGVAEQNLATVAAGMAAMGKIPYISSYAMFSPGRNWEQIRTTIAYNDVPVRIVGSHAGISVGPDGGTHQALEDMALMRVVPNMLVISPCDSIEAKKATIALSKVKTPAYIRLAREKTPVMTTLDTPFEIGKAQVYFDNDDSKVTIVATGALVHKALKVAKESTIPMWVINLATIKPLDTETLLAYAKKTKHFVTVEEHQVHGGMGSAVAEFLSQTYPISIEFVGVKDKFGESGTPDELIVHYGLDEKAIAAAVDSVLSRDTNR